MAPSRRAWTSSEQLIVLRYYLQTEFGRLHSSNPEIRTIAAKLGRTPSSIAMKGSNYASLDTKITETGRKGLSQASKLDRETWEFMQRSFQAFEDQSASAATEFGLDPSTFRKLAQVTSLTEVPPVDDAGFNGQTDRLTTVLTRRKQAFFRRTVLNAYRNTCAISEIAFPELLNASHIVPWRVDEMRRLDPANGISLNALHDRAFDRGLISFEDDLTVLVSNRLAKADVPSMVKAMIQDVAGQRAKVPSRFHPDPAALEYHRDTVFVG